MDYTPLMRIEQHLRRLRHKKSTVSNASLILLQEVCLFRQVLQEVSSFPSATAPSYFQA